MPRGVKGTRKTAKPVRARNRKPNTKGLVPFKKGEHRIGRAKGTPNKTTTLLKDAIIEASVRLGRDGKGKDGTVGYLMWLGRNEPAVYGRMLEKILPMQLEVKDTTKKTYTAEEAKAELEERGLPVPQSLADLVIQVHEQRDDRDEPQDDSEFNELAPDTPEVYAEDDDRDEDEQDDEDSDDA
jgi:hypothetical protein